MSIKKIPILAECEVLVVGGGTAGAVAGIASARLGAKTIIVEQFGYLGGSQSAALVTPMMPNHISGDPLVKGLNEEINERLKSIGAAFVDGNNNSGWFDPEQLKYVLEEMFLESGGRLLYHTLVVDAVVKKGKIISVITESKSGRAQIIAKQFIDCSGDADLSVRAGVPYESGRKEDGLSQAMSLRFHLGNVDLNKFCAFMDEIEPGKKHSLPFVHAASVWGKNYPLEPLFKKAVEEGVLEYSDGDYFQLFSLPSRPGEVSFNCPRIANNVKGTNVKDLTYAQIEGRKKIKRIIKFCKKYLPGFENAYLVYTAPMVGVRESRRIIGEYVLTLEDLQEAKKFPDTVAKGNYPVDIHLPKGAGVDYRPLKPGDYYTIPYRSLVPKGIENLLVAGRCISATFEAQSAIRIQPICRALGEAAGISAALCVKNSLSPRKLSYSVLANYLRL